jgi:phosphonate transport system substrate-binding protein
MKVLKLASGMAENTELFCRALAIYIQRQLGVRTQYVGGISWQERERLFDQGEIQLLWLCGLPYADGADSPDKRIELLAAPVPQGSRYHSQPIYFSDIVVKRTSRFRIFDHLRGSVWAYNELRSHSGFNVVRAYLGAHGKADGFFKETVESGAYLTSLQLLLNGGADVTAIDSTVLEWFVRQRPYLQNEIRVLASFGPSPVPPWVISTSVPENFRIVLRALFLRMNEEIAGRSVLARGYLEGFVIAQDSDYDPIRRMAETARRVSPAYESMINGEQILKT